MSLFLLITYYEVVGIIIYKKNWVFTERGRILNMVYELYKNYFATVQLKNHQNSTFHQFFKPYVLTSFSSKFRWKKFYDSVFELSKNKIEIKCSVQFAERYFINTIRKILNWAFLWCSRNLGSVDIVNSI